MAMRPVSKGWNPSMGDFLDVLAQDAKQTLASGYYAEIDRPCETRRSRGLKSAILGCSHAPIIAEIKRVSPSQGPLTPDPDIAWIADQMWRGGAIGLSILTEPVHFHGSLATLSKIRKQIALPLLMKDIVISHQQIDAASYYGADAILLIQALFDRGYSEEDLHEMIAYAHTRQLEVLLETHTPDELITALETDADLLGINNRNLRTLQVNLETTHHILHVVNVRDRIVVSESGISTDHDVQYLHEAGAQAFLVGSALMTSADVKQKVHELVMAV